MEDGMSKRHQLLEEAGRLRRLSQARRGDLAWAALSGRVSSVELDQRAAEARSLGLRAEALERDAEGLPEPLPAAQAHDPAADRRRRREALLKRAAAIREREATCQGLCERERAIGAEHKADFLEGVARQLSAKWRHLEAQANALPAVVDGGTDERVSLTPAPAFLPGR
jgi:outer membrane murein-binding lipoprotein Lpp